jgi:dipeptidyl aminopeptidase/acylaminoacyl peptidase
VPSPTFTLAPYEGYRIDYLRRRSYGQGSFEVLEVLSEHPTFTTYFTRYQSDGLFIYAVMNLPHAEGMHPVLIAVHGYVHPSDYLVVGTDFKIENELAERGYITIHPTLRNYPPSDAGDNLFRVGDTIDVLNLIAMVRAQAGSGPLEQADPERIALGGRSMGGGVVLRALTITRDVRAAYLYAPISGDEARNVEFFHKFADADLQFKGEVDAPADVIAAASAQNYYSDITASILLAHGTDDLLVPATWSEDTCNLLKEAGVDKRCIFYPRAYHTFYNEDIEDFIREIESFLQDHL